MINIFHIGYHKTATTWFQKHFYPFVSNYNLVNRNDIRNFFYENQEVSFKGKNDCIFCDEELSGNIHTGGHSTFLSKSIARKISEFENSKVIIFIRNQIDIIASSYLQYVKKGGSYSINRYLYHKDFPNSNRAALFSFQHFNYFDKIKYYEKLIGKDNVFVYVYEDFRSNNTKFIHSFVNEHNFAIDVEKISYKWKNESYSYINLCLSKFLNFFSREDVLYKYYLVHIPFLYKISSSINRIINFGKINRKKLLGKKNVEFIKSFYKKQNQLLQKEYNMDINKYNYPI